MPNGYGTEQTHPKEAAAARKDLQCQRMFQLNQLLLVISEDPAITGGSTGTWPGSADLRLQTP